jgi:hypothetical protein
MRRPIAAIVVAILLALFSFFSVAAHFGGICNLPWRFHTNSIAAAAATFG